ncbi:MAG: symmetrical bis(5'-nucleosyl)-tetraphosphatase [Methylophilus sp.]|nr:symmetrical bis(5'-nucleosyl)-tetraphosphatase [Methylophilus sp.]
MATYAIGDIQGCNHAFMALLSRLNFNPTQDKLWLVGDLINRGTGSLEVLRWCFQHKSSIHVVLGNHDLHAIAVAHHIKLPHRSDTLDALLSAEEGHQLLTWLRHQPLMVAQQGYAMVHAGLLPQWHLDEAMRYANEVEMALQSPHYVDFLKNMYGNMPNLWDADLKGFDRLRLITNALTRMRICTDNGELEFAFKGEVDEVPTGYMPWFKVPDRQTKDEKVICGHWSALGLYQQDNIIALDTGCLWGKQLTAFCLETQAITQVAFDARDKP